MKKLFMAAMVLAMALCACGETPEEAGSTAPELGLQSETSSVSTPEPAQSAVPDGGMPEVTISTQDIAQSVRDRYTEVPEDIAGSIKASAARWMEYVFTEMEQDGRPCPELEGYQCTGLEFFDVSTDETVVCYTARFEFKPKDPDDYEFWFAGNTTEADREGWWRFSRQIAVRVKGSSWEILTVGTGGVRAEDAAR